MTHVLRKRDTRAANKNNSATTRVQEHAKVALLAKICNVAGNARKVARVVFKRDAANGGAPMEYRLVLSAGSVCESVRVLEAPLELVAKCVHAVLDVERLLDK
jgi:hypothetical protein